jgi:dTDP-4-amino-4,6-dideoxygalactose transaminase
MEFLGYKSNMNNIQASLLIGQLSRIEKLLEKKTKIAAKYDHGFRYNSNLTTPKILPNTKHARLLYTIWVDPKKRDNIIHRLQKKGVGVAVNFTVIHLKKYYKNKYGFKKGDFPMAEKIGDSTISLPFYPKLTNREIAYVINAVNQASS